MEKIQNSVSKYSLTKNELEEFLETLKERIITNSNFIIEANKVDLKYNKKQIKVKEFLEIIDKYRNNENSLKEDDRKIVIYKGDPYLTLHICLQAFTQRTQVMIIKQNFMYGVNEVIFEIFNQLLDEFKISNLINVITGFSNQIFENIKKDYNEIVVIGDTTIYQKLQKEENNMKFYPYNNIVIYCEENKMKQLQEAIYIYANENFYEIEVLNVENFEAAVKNINKDVTKSIAVLITQNDKNKENFFYDIKNKEVFVNENPFKKDVGKVYNYLK